MLEKPIKDPLPYAEEELETLESLSKVHFEDERAQIVYQDVLHTVIEERRLRQEQFSKEFWDLQELERQTCMKRSFIYETFFHDKRFNKFKVGRQWLFPAKEAAEFLLIWLKEQDDKGGREL